MFCVRIRKRESEREREYVVNTFCMEHFVKKESNHRIGSVANQLEN